MECSYPIEIFRQLDLRFQGLCYFMLRFVRGNKFSFTCPLQAFVALLQDSSEIFHRSGPRSYAILHLMNTAFDILVIALGSLLGIFLILSIIVSVLALKVVASVRRVVAKGEQVIDSAEAAAEMFKRAAGPLGALRTIANVVETINKRRKGKE